MFKMRDEKGIDDKVICVPLQRPLLERLRGARRAATAAAPGDRAVLLDLQGPRGPRGERRGLVPARGRRARDRRSQGAPAQRPESAIPAGASGCVCAHRVSRPGMKIGYFLSSEEFGPRDWSARRAQAEEAGFEACGSPTTSTPGTTSRATAPSSGRRSARSPRRPRRCSLTTAVTCPTVRIHPAIVAHAAATCAVLLEGRFTLGLAAARRSTSTSSAIAGREADERLEMLEEAIEVIRTLWQGGMQSHRGRHYRVENARIYDLPERPPPILVSGFGPSRRGSPRGSGTASAPSPPTPSVECVPRQGGAASRSQGGMKVCWGEDEPRPRPRASPVAQRGAAGRARRRCCPRPRTSNRPASSSARSGRRGDPLRPRPRCASRGHPGATRDAGFDELYIQQIGPEQDGFFETYSREILPRLREHGHAVAPAS